MLQVVVRSGRAISAVPPDYRLLDYDTTNREYFYARLRLDTIGPSQPDLKLPLQIRQKPQVTMDSQTRRRSHSGSSSSSSSSNRFLARGLSLILSSEAAATPHFLGRSSAEIHQGTMVGTRADVTCPAILHHSPVLTECLHGVVWSWQHLIEIFVDHWICTLLHILMRWRNEKIKSSTA
jgi:hypothetical protein